MRIAEPAELTYSTKLVGWGAIPVSKLTFVSWLLLDEAYGGENEAEGALVAGSGESAIDADFDGGTLQEGDGIQDVSAGAGIGVGGDFAAVEEEGDGAGLGVRGNVEFGAELARGRGGLEDDGGGFGCPTVGGVDAGD